MCLLIINPVLKANQRIRTIALILAPDPVPFMLTFIYVFLCILFKNVIANI